SLDLPHDWSIEDSPGPESIGPFSRQSPGGPPTGHVLGGTGWYRKSFVLDEADAGKTVEILFDGVYMESDVWINGRHAGTHPYGYTPFYYNITSCLNEPGTANVVAVRVKNTGKNSRWYSGSGIYRHVWLTVKNPVYIAVWGVHITTPRVEAGEASVRLAVTAENTSAEKADCTLKTRIFKPDGRVSVEVRKNASLEAGGSSILEILLDVKDPVLWSVDNPQLYRAETELVMNDRTVDRAVTPFGIRTIRFSPDDGFQLNGELLELKGGCVHHDNGILGSAAFDRAEERRIEKLKASGFNAIRTSHNPPSQAFLDACDRLGMLVMDEAFDHWERPKNPEDYHRFFRDWWKRDLEAMLKRDRNHPSVIIWSIGNEINERADTSGVRIARELAGFVRAMDPTRPVTQAVCGFWDHPGKKWDDTAPAFEGMDVHGYNYQWREYEPDHAKYPERIMIGTESIAKEAFENWDQVLRHPYVIGDFVWTAMDYLGESGIGHTQYLAEGEKDEFAMPWPWFNSWCGDLDISGGKKPQSFYRDVVWGQSRLEMAVHAPVPEGRKEVVSYWGWPDEMQSWTWPGQEGRSLNVSVYSSCPAVRLELNGKTVGEQKIPEDAKWTTVFDVPYESGELKAVGLEGGKPVAEKILCTAGPARRILLKPERVKTPADRKEVEYIGIEVADEKGVILPEAKIPVRLEIQGPAELQAAGNAGPDDMASFKQPGCRTFRGRALVIVRSTGETGTIKVTATSEGLETATAVIQAR
ncbi:DUF4982 domain-containing protein, partial [bacterium]|nr:DUF4982 domain-containing protein [bacterium]